MEGEDSGRRKASFGRGPTQTPEHVIRRFLNSPDVKESSIGLIIYVLRKGMCSGDSNRWSQRTNNKGFPLDVQESDFTTQQILRSTSVDISSDAKLPTPWRKPRRRQRSRSACRSHALSLFSRNSSRSAHSSGEGTLTPSNSLASTESAKRKRNGSELKWFRVGPKRAVDTRY